MDTPNALGTDARSAKKIDQMAEVKQFTIDELQNLKLIHSGMGESKEIKAFRDLRTRLISRSQGKSFSCLVVAAQTGGSHVAANLAAAIALDKSKTSILVDCNLYSPSIDSYMPGGASLGLTDYIDDDTLSGEDIIHGTGINRMRAVPVGSNCEGGTEKLMSSRMKAFLDEAANRYPDRFVVVDAPSITDYEADVRILADICDFVLLVIPYGRISAPQLTTTIEKIGKSRLAGVVFNEC